MKKLIFMAVGISTVIGALVLSRDWTKKAKESGPFPNREKTARLDAPLLAQADVLAASDPPAPPRNTQEMKDIRKLNFEECKKAVNKEQLEKCMVRMSEESYRLSQVRDPALVPGLIEIAEQKRFKFPPAYLTANPVEKMLYRQRVCDLRYGAIRALGEIKDQAAVEPLLSIMEEKYSLDAGCFFAWEGHDQNSICTEAGKALIKLEPADVSARLFRDLERSWPAYEVAERSLTMRDGGVGYLMLSATNAIDMSAMNSMLADFNGPGCYLTVLGNFNDEETKKLIISELGRKKLSDSKAAMYLTAAGYFSLNLEDIEVIKPYLQLDAEKPDEKLQNIAVAAVTNNPNPAYVGLYIELVNHGFVREGFEAMGKTKSLEALAFVSQELKGRYSVDAAKALFNFEGNDIRPFVPALVELIKTSKTIPDESYYNAIIKSQDPSVIPFFIEQFYLIQGKDAIRENNNIKSIGLIVCPESQEALKRLIADDNVSLRYRALKYLVYQVGQEGIDYGMQYLDPEVIKDSRDLIGALHYHDIKASPEYLIRNRY